jgi:hypothetical protein
MTLMIVLGLFSAFRGRFVVSRRVYLSHQVARFFGACLVFLSLPLTVAIELLTRDAFVWIDQEPIRWAASMAVELYLIGLLFMPFYIYQRRQPSLMRRAIDRRSRVESDALKVRADFNENTASCN